MDRYNYTKPSRVNRHLKRRWRKNAQAILTRYRTLLDNRRAVGAPIAGHSTPNNGHKRPLKNSGFFFAHQKAKRY